MQKGQVIITRYKMSYDWINQGFVLLKAGREKKVWWPGIEYMYGSKKQLFYNRSNPLFAKWLV